MSRQPKEKSFTDLYHDANAHRKTLGLEPASEVAPPRNKGVEFDFSKLDLDSLVVMTPTSMWRGRSMSRLERACSGRSRGRDSRGLCTRSSLL
jgi:hypothetical protein